MSSMKKGLALGGAVISSALAAACCLGPLVLVLLGGTLFFTISSSIDYIRRAVGILRK